MKLFHHRTNNKKGAIEMLKDFLKIFKRSRENRKTKAVAFVDFENWFFALKKFYNLKPDVIEWRKGLEEKFELQDLYVFGNFTSVEMKEELPKIRCVTNSIIETQQGTDKYEKDMTDFVMLDFIYQYVNENADIDTYIIFSGDAHFQSVVNYLIQKCGKKVVAYGIKNAFSNQLKLIASEAVELPASEQILEGLYPLIVKNMDYVSGKFTIIPTYAATARTLAKEYDIPEELFRAALTDMLEKGLLCTKKQRVGFNQFVSVISANWEALVEAGLWSY